MPTDDAYYPPASFYFEVSIRDPEGADAPPGIDGAFREVSGLEREMGVEEIREGGQNLGSYRVPTRGRHPNLVLKRGLVVRESKLATWAEDTVTSVLSRPIALKEVDVTLLNPSGQPLVSWTFSDAYPVKWVTAPLDAMNASLAVETLELTYSWSARRVQASAAQGI